MKKSAKIALGVAGILVLAGLVAGGVWLAGRSNEEVGGAEGEDKPLVGSTVASFDELPDGELDFENEAVARLVDGLYGQFEISPIQWFYSNVMLEQANEGLREDAQLQMALNQAENWSGEAVRRKYREMFGEEIELTEEKYGHLSEGSLGVPTGMKFVAYDAAKDEFVELESGTDVGGKYLRRLERAEKTTVTGAGSVGDNSDGAGEDDAVRETIYLYERALTMNCKPDPRFDEEGNQIGGGSACEILMAATTCGTPEFGWDGASEGMTDEEIFARAKKENLGLVRWTFEKNGEGKYVFKGLEPWFEGE